MTGSSVYQLGFCQCSDRLGHDQTATYWKRLAEIPRTDLVTGVHTQRDSLLLHSPHRDWSWTNSNMMSWLRRSRNDQVSFHLRTAADTPNFPRRFCWLKQRKCIGTYLPWPHFYNPEDHLLFHFFPAPLTFTVWPDSVKLSHLWLFPYEIESFSFISSMISNLKIHSNTNRCHESTML